MEHEICGLQISAERLRADGGAEETENNADLSLLSPIVSFITSVPRTIGEAVTADRTGHGCNVRRTETGGTRRCD